MGGMHEYAVCRQTGDFADVPTVSVGYIFRKAAVIYTQQNDLLILHCQCQRIDFQCIQYTFRKTGLVITDNGNTQRGRYIQAAETSQ